jgi:hypothetical protein
MQKMTLSPSLLLDIYGDVSVDQAQKMLDEYCVKKKHPKMMINQHHH